MLGKALLSASASASAPAVYYVEDVFSTYLYTGNGSTQTITNDIDLAGEGGLVWLKRRDSAQDHGLFDTTRGATKYIQSNGTDAETTNATSLTNFNSDGFTLGSFFVFNNDPSRTYASWTFRKAPRFFDVVTYTGTGVQRDLPHSLGSAPGCMIVKRTSSTEDWAVYHRSLNGGVTPYNYFLRLDATIEQTFNTTRWVQDPTATHFTVGTHTEVNTAGQTYVAYIFAHNAGGFGDAGADNVISCGSFTTDGSGTATVNLGWEPQWILAKRSDNVQDWKIIDTMRGFAIPSSSDATLYPNASSAEGAGSDWGAPTATGFTADSQPSSANFIYIAIRRGPMRAPTSGTEVFAASTAAAGTLFATGITSLDAAFIVNRTVNGGARFFFSRLAASRGLDPTSTATEANYGTAISWDLNNAFYQSAIGSSVQWLFRRAPGFFDVVAYTGTGSGTTVIHNLGVAPELIITKRRNSTSNWGAFHSFTPTQNGYNYLDLSGAGFNATYGTSSRAFQSQPTSTQFITGGQAQIDSSGGTYVAYLFATLAGVSKVGSYTGTGADLNVDCGFSAGARFILIKRTDGNGDWHYWDSVRGITNGNDPFLRYNSSAGQQTGTDLVEPLPSGFIVTGNGSDPGWDATNKLNSTYIFLAIS